MRYALLGLLCLIIISCRELEPLTGSQVIDGYQIDGRVTTVNGVPIDSVEVKLYYYYTYFSSTPIDTIPVVVTDSLKVVDISVVDRKFRFIRTIFFGLWGRTGIIPRIYWNGRDLNNQPVLSGLYYIQYIVDTVLVKSSPVIVDGHVTAITDNRGRFSIVNYNLPIGSVFDVYNDDDSFYGVMKVLPKVAT